ncbi:hypothetical protein HK098_006994 [Nowakowskiella sp. JEL0407]|nr:hypothetical protein HK098_006994 [Nowakowskiella sp. JEL0407]
MQSQDLFASHLRILASAVEYSTVNQIQQAVPFLASGGQNDAITAYCNNILLNPLANWKIACYLFLKLYGDSSFEGIQIRLFSLNILANLLSSFDTYTTLPPDAKSILYSILWDYISTLSFSEQSIIRAKFPLILALLIRNVFPHESPEIFDKCFELLRTSDGGKLLAVTDLIVKMSVELDNYVVTPSRTANLADVGRMSLIKDKMREMRVVDKLTSIWLDILIQNTGGDGNTELAALCLSCFASYVKWIDIGLVVNERFLTLVYGLLSHEKLQNQAIQCLEEILGKGMAFAAKLNLIRMLRIDSVLTQFQPLFTTESEDDEFVTSIAKLINKLGLEICKCFDEADTPDPTYLSGSTSNEIKQESFLLLMEYFPWLIICLKSSFDDTSVLVHDYLTRFISIVGRVVGKLGDMEEQVKSKLWVLMEAIASKIKYDEEEECGFGKDAGEMDAEFLEMRRALKSNLVSVAGIYRELFVAFCFGIVEKVFDELDTTFRNITGKHPDVF